MGDSSIQSVSFQTVLLVNGREEISKRRPKVWAPAANVGDHDKVPGSCLLPGPTWIIKPVLGVNQQMEDFLLSLPLC